MSDMKIEVDFTDLAQAKTANDTLQNSFSAMVNKIVADANRLNQSVAATEKAWANAAANRIRLIQNTQAAEQKAIQQSARDLQYIERLKDREHKSFIAQTNARIALIRRSQEAEERAAQAATRAAQQEAAAIADLTKRFAPAAAAQAYFHEQVAEANRAMSLGVISADQYREAVARLNYQLVQAQKGVYVTGSGFNQFGDIVRTGGQSVNKFGMYSQQAGYQVADFAVQIQGGTSALVALGQQGSQFLALFGAGGAIAGAILAVGTSLALMIPSIAGVGKGLEDLESDLSDFKEVEDIFKSAGVSLEANLGDAIDVVRAKFGDLVADILQFRLDQFQQKLSADFEAVSQANTPSFFDRVMSGYAGGLAARGGNYGYQQELYDEDQAALERSQQIYDILEQTVTKSGETTELGLSQAFADALAQIEQIQGITEQEITSVKTLGEEAGFFTALTEEAARAEEERADALNSTREAAIELGLAYSEQLRSLQQANELASVAAQYGEDSIQYQRAKMELEAEAFAIEQSREGMTGVRLQTLVEEFEYGQNLNAMAEGRNALMSIYTNFWSTVSEQMSEIVEKQAEADALFSNTYQTQAQRLGLLATELEYGRESTQYQNLKNVYELNSLETQLQIAGVEQDQIDILLEQLAAIQEAEAALANQMSVWEQLDGLAIAVLNTMEAIAGTDISGPIWNAVSAAGALLGSLSSVLGAMASINGQIGAIGIRTAVTQAENEALEGGASPAEARAAGQLAQFEMSLPGELNNPIMRTVAVAGMRDALAENVAAEEANQALVSAARDAARGGGGGSGRRRGGRGGGGGSARADTPDAIEKLQKEMEQRRHLLTLFGEERDLQEEIYRLEQSLGEDRKNYSDEQIAAVAQQNLALQEQEERYDELIQKQQDIANMFENELSDGWRSMVTGAESFGEAFKKTLADIILNLGEVLFMQNLVGSWDASSGTGTGATGWIMGAVGGLFGHANGGQVQGGRPIMIGERGPELWVPPATGNIIPNETLRAQGGGQIELRIHTADGVTTEVLNNTVDAKITRAQPMLTSTAVKASQNNMKYGSKMPWGL